MTMIKGLDNNQTQNKKSLISNTKILSTNTKNLARSLEYLAVYLSGLFGCLGCVSVCLITIFQCTILQNPVSPKNERQARERNVDLSDGKKAHHYYVN